MKTWLSGGVPEGHAINIKCRGIRPMPNGLSDQIARKHNKQNVAEKSGNKAQSIAQSPSKALYYFMDEIIEVVEP